MNLKNFLNEALLTKKATSEDIKAQYILAKKESVLEFIKKNYICYSTINYRKGEPYYEYDYQGFSMFYDKTLDKYIVSAEEVTLNKDIKYLTNDDFKFGAVDYFYIIDKPNIKSLEGIAHDAISIAIQRSGITDLKGLEDCKLQNLTISACQNFESLKGLPKYVYKLNLKYLPRLKTFKDQHSKIRTLVIDEKSVYAEDYDNIKYDKLDKLDKLK